MKNKIAKTIGVLGLASLMTTTAHAQLTISGYVEAGFLTGNTEGTLNTVSSKGFGGETVVTVAGKGKLSNGWEYTASQNFDSDDNLNGRNNQTNAQTSVMSTRAITLSPMPALTLVYTYDGVYGGEIARTAVPVVTERVGDLTGNATISEFVDVTSGSHAVGFDVNSVLGDKSRLSVVYNPNLDAQTGSSSDRSYSGSGQTNYVNRATGYSIGYLVPAGPLSLRAGMTKIDQKQLNGKDVDSKTAGITYTAAPFAIGIQRTKNDGQKAATTTANAFKDKVDTVAVSYGASKELTVGATYSTMDRSGATIQGTDAKDLKVYQFVAAYNLGPVVVSGAYEIANNRAITNGATTSGLDATTAKVKVKANF